jgi:hypothetical protein
MFMTTGQEGASPERTETLVQLLSNDDIRWDGTAIGLLPEVTGDSAKELLESGGEIVPQLMKALEDPSKFIAAHVLLTLITKVQYSSLPWNGLALDISADNKVSVDPDSRAAILRQWQDWCRTDDANGAPGRR